MGGARLSRAGGRGQRHLRLGRPDRRSSISTSISSSREAESPPSAQSRTLSQFTLGPRIHSPTRSSPVPTPPSQSGARSRICTAHSRHASSCSRSQKVHVTTAVAHRARLLSAIKWLHPQCRFDPATPDCIPRAAPATSPPTPTNPPGPEWREGAWSRLSTAPDGAAVRADGPFEDAPVTEANGRDMPLWLRPVLIRRHPFRGNRRIIGSLTLTDTPSQRALRSPAAT